MSKILMAVFSILIFSVSVQAEELVIEMHRIDTRGVGKAIGTVKASSSPHGTILTPNLRGLSPGLHGFHVHEKASCAPGMKGDKRVAGLSAGGHYDPRAAGRHQGPYASGHLGDLPALFVDANGEAKHPGLAPRLKVSDLKGRALIIHAGGDNYSDFPKKLGGGGARVACGVVR